MVAIAGTMRAAPACPGGPIGFGKVSFKKRLQEAPARGSGADLPLGVDGARRRGFMPRMKASRGFSWCRLGPAKVCVAIVTLGFGALGGDGVAQAQARPPRETAAREQMFPVDARWRVVSLGKRSYGENGPSFQINAQFRAEGFSGCNIFSATAYPLRGRRFAVGPLALTRKACPPAEMALERDFLVAFKFATSWRIEGTMLVLGTPRGELRARRGL